MNKQISNMSTWLTYSLCAVLTVQPALANVVIDGNSANTSKTQAGNGVEVVNIATPNNKGLSHNKYQKFDVDSQGLILNNSTQQLSQSQLGGLLQNNPNLKGRAADVILNEVTGANRSQLEGYTEIVGQQANVILANPYGITCDGCGFINTPRVTLSTGQPDIQNGLVSGFNVADGSVTIEGLGLDATQQTYFDIISRTAEINANIHANDLAIVTGKNHVSYQTNQATASSVPPSSNAPALAIDSSSLGGMYAGRISLVATEQGVGVNVGNLVSNTGDLLITANGDIVLGNANSANNLILNSQQDLTLVDAQTAQKAMSLTAQNIQVQQSQIVVDEALSVYADNVLLTDAVIEAEQINTAVNDIMVDEQSELSATSITMTDLSSLNNHGQVYARDTLSIQGDNTTLAEDGLITASNVIIQSPQLTIDTRLQTDNAQIVSDQLFTLTQDARLEATNNVEFTAGQLDLIGDTVANNQIDVTVNGAANIQGTLLGKHVNLTANDTQVQGELHANEALTVTTETLTNTGGMTSSRAQQINVDSDMTNYGWVYAADSLDFRIQGTLLNQQGEILSGGDIQIRGRQGNELAQSVNNASGTIHANQSLAIYASTILNKPTTVNFNSETTNGDYSFGSVEGFSVGWGSSYTPETRTEDRNCNVFGSNCEHWKISQDTEVTLLTRTTNSTLTNSAPSQITADGNITLVSEQITNELGLIHAGQDLNITTESLVNQGYTTGRYRDYSLYKHYSTEGDPIRQFDYVRLNTQTQTLNEETHQSTIAAGGKLTIDANSLINNSEMSEGNSSQIMGLTPQATQQQSAATLTYPLPKNNHGLFIYQPNPKGKYLIETNPLLTNMGQFLGSDYFMTRVGFNPQKDVKFLGDAFYDSKIISQAIFEQTGLRYLNQSIGSQLDQMQQLIDAAATQKNALNLSAGTALSDDQIARLTQDILWYEEVLVNGQTVLAPKLYLAQATLDNLNQGALIAATDVAVSADNITNSASINADSSLNLTSTNSIRNLGGSITSNADLSLLAKQDIINLSGEIQGSNVSLTATHGDIVNETLATTLTSTLGSSSSTSTTLGKTASISAAGNLALSAGNNIKDLAADITSQGEMNLTAGQNIIVSSKENTLNASGSFGGEASTSQIGSSITAGGNVSLNAGNDITVSASKLASQQTLSLEAGNNVTIETALNKQSDSTNLTNYTSINRSEQHQRSTLTGNNVTIKANNGATLSGSTITAAQSVSIEAKGDVNILAVSDSQYHYDKTDTAKSFGRSQITTNETYREQVNGSAITAGGNVSLNASNDITVSASQLASQQTLSLEAGNNVTIETALNKQSDSTNLTNYTSINRSEQHQRSTLTGNNVTIKANNGATLSGSTITAAQSVSIEAKGDVNILAVSDSQYHYDKTDTAKSFGRSQITTNETYREQVNGSAITAGGDITVKAQNLASAITAGGDSDINIIGSSLNARGEVALSADGDVTMAAQTYREFERHETMKKGFAGLSGSNKGSLDNATLLNSSYLINSGNTTVIAGKDIGVIASEVTSDGNVNLEAVNEVLIAAGEVLKQSQEWDEKTKFLSGGNLFEMEKKREGQQSSTAQSSVIQSAGHLTVNAGSIKVIGSELSAQQNVELTADTGDIEILAAKETTQAFTSEETISVGFGDDFGKVKVEDGRLNIALGEANYDKVKQQTDALTHKGSAISANDSVSLDAESSILVEGSTLTADRDQNQSGDILLSANQDINIVETVDTLTEQREEISGKAEASLVVQNQAVEVAKAVQALKVSTQKLKQAEQDYKQYKKGLESLESTLGTLEQEYADKKPGVTFADIEELRDLIAQVESDEAWYIAGVALATEDVVSKTTGLTQQTAALATSVSSCAYCFGFNAGLQLDIAASKNSSTSQRTTSNGSSLSGQNIVINAGNNEGDQLNIQGSQIAANDALSLAANEINLTASQDTLNTKSEMESGQINAQMTVFGASTGINVNASYNRNQSTSASTTHNNTLLSGDTISLTSNQDTNIKGATVTAENSLEANIGGDLNIASVQDRYTSNNQGAGISGGVSLTGGQTSDGTGTLPLGALASTDGAGELTGINGGINASNGRTNSKQTVLTSLTSGGDANITVGGNTDVTGALIATVDEQGNDSGKLNLTTDSLTYADLSNTRYSQNQSLGVNAGYGIKQPTESGAESAQATPNNTSEDDSKFNSSSYQYTNTSSYDKGKMLATIGQGTLTLSDPEASDDLTALNRDTEHTEKDLFTVDRKQGDFDVTVDHRLLTEEGRAQIKEDVKRTHLAGQSLADVALEDSVKLADTFEHMDVVQKELDVQLLIAQKKGDAAVNINNLENATAQQKQDAINDYAAAYSELFGISIESALVIAVNKSIGGAHYMGDKGSNIVLNDASMKNAQDYMNTLAHEVTHGLEKQGIIGDKGEQGENYAELIGGYAEGNYEFALENSGLGKVNKGNTNSHIGNDSALVTGNSDGFTKKETELKSGEIDYMNIPHVENIVASGVQQESLKDYNAAEEIINENAKSKEAIVNYFSIALGGVSCVGGNLAGCAGSGIATSDLGEVLTKDLEQNNVGNDPIQNAMMDLIPDYIKPSAKKTMTDLLLGGYGIKDIHKMPKAKNKIDAIIESLNKSSEIGSAEVYIETMESNIRKIWNQGGQDE
ncbi:hemagglutinin repeat-containing protein [Vibrio sp. TRT 1302]|uniref:hemagglutinin repeat-containing protein n=1 Tax=Vibrio sp. TRT 1302 TaxID=3418504 RepID=UPI003CE9407D